MSFQNACIKATNADPNEYHKQSAERGTPEFVLSSTALREFDRCPARWKAGYESPDSDAKDFGSLLDCRLLTPHLFGKRYAIQPANYTNEKDELKPWNNNARVCREWHSLREGVEVVRSVDVGLCDDAISRLRSDEIISEFIAASDVQVWLTGEWQDEASGLTVPVKALLDMVPRLDTIFSKCLGDLKTTRNGAIMPWQRWCFTAGYHVQAALFTDLYIAATGEDRNTFCFIVQENYPPWQPAKRMLSQDFLTLGRAEVNRMLSAYCACVKHNRWPGYDDTDEAVQGWSLVAPELWMAERAQFAPRFEFAVESTPAEQDSIPGEILP